MPVILGPSPQRHLPQVSVPELPSLCGKDSKANFHLWLLIRCAPTSQGCSKHRKQWSGIKRESLFFWRRERNPAVFFIPPCLWEADFFFFFWNQKADLEHEKKNDLDCVFFYCIYREFSWMSFSAIGSKWEIWLIINKAINAIWRVDYV